MQRQTMPDEQGLLPAARQGARASRLTARQILAIYGVMRLLRDDRPPLSSAIDCRGCKRRRRAHGSVTYDDRLLCNGCATDYELLRAAGLTRELQEFLRDDVPPARDVEV